jgi:hypothetical protein
VELAQHPVEPALQALVEHGVGRYGTEHVRPALPRCLHGGADDPDLLVLEIAVLPSVGIDCSDAQPWLRMAEDPQRLQGVLDRLSYRVDVGGVHALDQQLGWRPEVVDDPGDQIGGHGRRRPPRVGVHHHDIGGDGVPVPGVRAILRYARNQVRDPDGETYPPRCG